MTNQLFYSSAADDYILAHGAAVSEATAKATIDATSPFALLKSVPIMIR